VRLARIAPMPSRERNNQQLELRKDRPQSDRNEGSRPRPRPRPSIEAETVQKATLPVQISILTVPRKLSDPSSCPFSCKNNVWLGMIPPAKVRFSQRSLRNLSVGFFADSQGAGPKITLTKPQASLTHCVVLRPPMHWQPPILTNFQLRS
jgi:hypothetical protein